MLPRRVNAVPVDATEITDGVPISVSALTTRSMVSPAATAAGIVRGKLVACPEDWTPAAELARNATPMSVARRRGQHAPPLHAAAVVLQPDQVARVRRGAQDGGARRAERVAARPGRPGDRARAAGGGLRE